MIASILLKNSEPLGYHITSGYIIGTLLALLVFAYLVYSLIKPEKF
jgi:K+-transporting ATPase KdpF subunit